VQHFAKLFPVHVSDVTAGWKKMEERLVEYMHEVQAHRLAAERLRIIRRREQIAVAAWVKFRLGYPAERLLPSGADILTWDKVKAIIELPSSVPTKEKDEIVAPEVETPKIITEDAEEDTDDEMWWWNPPKTSPEIEITVISPATFTHVFSSMSAFISEWEDANIRKLGGLSSVGPMLISFYPVSVHLSTLRLAASVFACEDSSCIHHWIDHYQNSVYPVMWYPEVLHHPCNTVTRRIKDDDKDAPFNPLLKASKDFPYCRRKEWSSDSLFPDEKASRTVKRILEACGLDDMITTTEDMDKLDARFICLKCSYGARCDGQRPRKVMSWRNAVHRNF
jgi:hypothetical protein